MKITDVRTVLLTGPYSKDPYILEGRPRRSAAFIEIHTDTELVGLGETYAGYFFPEGVPPVAVSAPAMSMLPRLDAPRGIRAGVAASASAAIGMLT